MENKENQFIWSICGHESILKFLQTAVENNKVNQPYLFHGQSGLGKYAVAKEFSKAILCNDKASRPCHKCSSCMQIDKGGHFDFYQLQRLTDEESGKDKRDISIEQVRDLISKMKQGSLLGGHKIAVVRGAQHLNINASNALLKTLEESSAKTVIILVADDISRLPKTIASRCQSIKFLPVPIKKIENYLIKIGASQSEAKTLSRISNGAPGKAIEFFQNSEAKEKYFKNIRCFNDAINSPLSQRWKIVSELVSKEEVSDGHQILDDFLTAGRDMLLLSNSNEMLTANFEFWDNAKKNRQLDSNEIQIILKNINLAKLHLYQNISLKNSLENFLINLP